MDNDQLDELKRVTLEGIRKLMHQVRTVVLAITLGLLLCLCVFGGMVYKLIAQGENEVEVFPCVDYNFNLSIDVGNETHEGVATIIASDGDTLIIHLGDNIYITPRTNVRYN